MATAKVFREAEHFSIDETSMSENEAAKSVDAIRTYKTAALDYTGGCHSYLPHNR